MGTGTSRQVEIKFPALAIGAMLSPLPASARWRGDSTPSTRPIVPVPASARWLGGSRSTQLSQDHHWLISTRLQTRRQLSRYSAFLNVARHLELEHEIRERPRVPSPSRREGPGVAEQPHNRLLHGVLDARRRVAATSRSLPGSMPATCSRGSSRRRILLGGGGGALRRALRLNSSSRVPLSLRGPPSSLARNSVGARRRAVDETGLSCACGLSGGAKAAASASAATHASAGRGTAIAYVIMPRRCSTCDLAAAS